MIFVILLVAVSSFGLGVLTAALCLSAKEGDLEVEYREAWERVLGR